MLKSEAAIKDRETRSCWTYRDIRDIVLGERGTTEII